MLAWIDLVLRGWGATRTFNHFVAAEIVRMSDLELYPQLKLL